LQVFDFIEAKFAILIVFEFFLMTCVSVVNTSSHETQNSPKSKGIGQKRFASSEKTGRGRSGTNSLFRSIGV